MRRLALLLALAACSADEDRLRAERDRLAHENELLQQEVAILRDKLKRWEEVREQAEAEKKSGLKVSLPSGAAQEIDLSAKSLVILIPVSGDVAINGKTVADEQLDDLFQRAFLDDKATQVVIQSDKGVPHGRIVNLMERAKAAGLTKLAIGTSGSR
jgi:biopolymer transport protein ExbD